MASQFGDNDTKRSYIPEMAKEADADVNADKDVQNEDSVVKNNELTQNLR